LVLRVSAICLSQKYNLISIVCSDPFINLAVMPNTFSFKLTLSIYYWASTVLNAVKPFALILTSIWICIYAHSMFFIHSVLTFIFTAICPSIDTFTVHNSVFKCSFKNSSIYPFKSSQSWQFILKPVTRVPRPIWPEINTETLFNTIKKNSVIIASIRPNFNAFIIWI